MVYAAFMIGILGSLHCLGMCGPIAFALPVKTNIPYLKLLKYLTYNLGRILTYAGLGFIIGIAGKGLALAGLQQLISIVAGVLVITSVMIVYNPLKKLFANSFTYSLNVKLKQLFHQYFQRTGFLSLFILGLLNGLLPCGMVYMAMVGTLATGSPFQGALFMVAFGLGTVPMMLSVSLLGNSIGIKFRAIVHKSMPIVGCAIGILLITRGLNLNLPLSGSEKSCCQVHKCH